MFIRRATIEELESVRGVLEESRKFLVECGSTQWQKGYPTREIVVEDITQGRCWVVVQEGEGVKGEGVKGEDGKGEGVKGEGGKGEGGKGEGEIIATASVGVGEDPTYRVIEGGAWLTTGTDYMVIHRVGVVGNQRGKGLVRWFMGELERIVGENKQVKSVRIDTHQNNAPMRAIIEGSGYTYCGLIYVWDGTQRMAYEKLLNT